MRVRRPGPTAAVVLQREIEQQVLAVVQPLRVAARALPGPPRERHRPARRVEARRADLLDSRQRGRAERRLERPCAGPSGRSRPRRLAGPDRQTAPSAPPASRSRRTPASVTATIGACARPMARLRPAEMFAPGLHQQRDRQAARAASPGSRPRVPSVEPPSTTTISSGGRVWTATLANRSARLSASLRTVRQSATRRDRSPHCSDSLVPGGAWES